MFDDYLLGHLSLPGDLFWSDEFAWSETVGKQSTAINGALIQEFSKRLAGRPITLQAGNNFAWISRALFDQLITLANDPLQPAYLLRTPDGREFSVRFRPENNQPAVTAVPLRHIWPAQPDDWLVVTIRLIQV